MAGECKSIVFLKLRDRRRGQEILIFLAHCATRHREDAHRVLVGSVGIDVAPVAVFHPSGAGQVVHEGEEAGLSFLPGPFDPPDLCFVVEEGADGPHLLTNNDGVEICPPPSFLPRMSRCFTDEGEPGRWFTGLEYLPADMGYLVLDG